MAGPGQERPQRVLVVGLGLIGGSVALAARARLGAEVLGLDADPATLALAREQGVAAWEADSAPADVVVVATPVPALEDGVRRALDASPQAVVTDVGSTKSALASAGLGHRYVGGHPLAGSELSGFAHARADLFDGATWFLTPTSDTEGVLLERLHRFLTGIGAKPAVIDASDHDRLMAAFSHLPHVVANVLALGGRAALGEQPRPVVGPSFRDATRVAGANPALWAGIYASNRDALVADLDAAIAALGQARDLIASGDTAALEAWQAEAADARRALAEHGRAGGAVEEVRVIVPNRPGVVADLTLTLARAGINIQDMSLQPAADNRSGEVALWVPCEDAAQARALVAEVAGTA